MKRNARTETEIERKRKHLALTLRAIIILLILLILINGKRREYAYKRVIYDYEKHTSFAAQAADTTETVQTVGRPQKPYWLMPTTPKYKHFWELY